MAAKEKRRDYKKRPGLLLAARELNCDYSHLRRVVLGERPGPLLERYRALDPKLVARKYLNSPKPVKPHASIHNLAAGDNLDPQYFAILAKLGLQVVITHFDCDGKPELIGPAYCEKELEEALTAVQAGSWDSTAYNAGSISHFFHVNNLALAMATLKEAIAARGLLPHVTILHSEESRQLRVWYPPTAALVTEET